MPTELKKVSSVSLGDGIVHSKNLSGIGFVDDFLILAADEGNTVQILRESGSGYELVLNHPLNEDGKEIDIESVAVEGRTVYLLGSHAMVRKKLKDDDTVAENRLALRDPNKVKSDPHRDVIFRVELNGSGTPEDQVATSLHDILKGDPTLSRFTNIPSKENGVDLEGLAVRDGVMFIGFRGPVLRDNWTPVMVCAFAKQIHDYELRYINLNGHGVRDIDTVEGGFLILSGPNGTGPGEYFIWFWDGGDMLPGVREGESIGVLKLLANVPADGEKPEGMAVIEETATGYEFLLVCDGAVNGRATRYTVGK